MALLGEDGGGYDLARKLEAEGVWRKWLGDSSYGSFIPYLSSASSWDTFMRSHHSLRVRALLFDKASVSLFVPIPSASALNPSYWQLQGDDLYYPLESSSSLVKNNSEAVNVVGSTYKKSEMGSPCQSLVNDDLPETWYGQFIEKYRNSRPYKLSTGSLESNKRMVEDMSSYLKLAEKNKRKHAIGLDNSNSVNDDVLFFPELFTWNCVPESALPASHKLEDKQKVDICGILDILHSVVARSPVMIERLGVRPEYLNSEQGGSSYPARNASNTNRKRLGEDQALALSQKVISRMLVSLGFEGVSEIPLGVLAQLLSCHICKLGRALKVLADNYRKQCSAIELLKMFMKASGFSLVALSELVKEGRRNIPQQAQLHIQEMQNQLQAQQQGSLRIPQQISRQLHPQVQQMINSPSLAYPPQQHMEMLRRRQMLAQAQAQAQAHAQAQAQAQVQGQGQALVQVSAPRTSMDIDKIRPMAQVKLENAPDLPLDSSVFNSGNMRHPQIQQLRQQQIAATMSNLQSQSANPFRQMPAPQVPQMQTQTVVRAPPMKVEGFQELMGGDPSTKCDSENKLMSPPSSK